MRRQPPKRDIGNAISTEDALSMLVVIFVLFILFLVPMVNIDKMKLEKANKNNTWEIATKFIQKHSIIKKIIHQYENTFDIDTKNDRYIITKISPYINYIEIKKANDGLIVIKHNKNKKTYISIIAQNFTDVVTYKFGSISKDGNEYFTFNDNIGYGDSDKSKNFKKEYEEFVLNRYEKNK